MRKVSRGGQDIDCITTTTKCMRREAYSQCNKHPSIGGESVRLI